MGIAWPQDDDDDDDDVECVVAFLAQVQQVNSSGLSEVRYAFVRDALRLFSPTCRTRAEAEAEAEAALH